MPLCTFHQCDGEDAVLQQAAVGVGEEQRARLGVLADADVGLGEADADPGGVRRRRTGRSAGAAGTARRRSGRLAQRLGGGAAARVPVQVHEVDRRPGDRTARSGSRCRRRRRRRSPSGQLAGMVSTAPTLMRRVDRLHRVGVRDDAVGVAGRALVGVVVGLPGRAVVAVAVVLVADRPVLGAVALGDVGVAHPVGRLLGGAGAVVGDDHRLGADPPDRAHERVEVGVRAPRTRRARCGLPVVDVGVGAARVAHHPHAGGLEQVRRPRGAELGVPDGVVDAQRGVRDRGQSGPGVDGDWPTGSDAASAGDGPVTASPPVASSRLAASAVQRPRPSRDGRDGGAESLFIRVPLRGSPQRPAGRGCVAHEGVETAGGTDGRKCWRRSVVLVAVPRKPSGSRLPLDDCQPRARQVIDASESHDDRGEFKAARRPHPAVPVRLTAGQPPSPRPRPPGPARPSAGAGRRPPARYAGSRAPRRRPAPR